MPIRFRTSVPLVKPNRVNAFKRRAWRATAAGVAFASLLAPLHAPADSYPSGPHLLLKRGAPLKVPTYQQQPFVYNGGAVLPDTTIYSIWWGNTGDFPGDAVDGMTTFFRDLDGSAYLGIANQYLFGAPVHTHFGGNFFDSSAPPGTDPFADVTPLTDEVCKVAAQRDLVRGESSIFAIFSSKSPPQSVYCAFHWYGTCSDGAVVHFAYMPNDKSTFYCTPDDADPYLQPNHYSEGTHTLANITAHELMETITDPHGDGWLDPSGNEIGDACAWSFRSSVPLVGSLWKLQMIWSNETTGCEQAGNRDQRAIGAVLDGGVRRIDITAAALGAFDEGINSTGISAGGYVDSSNIGHGFVREPTGAITPVDVPEGFYGTWVAAINDSGTVAGNYFDSNFVTHGYVRKSNGRFVTVDPPVANGGWAVLHSINASGVVAGTYLDANGVSHGYFGDPSGLLSTFDPPGAGHSGFQGTIALAINRSGVITGYFTDDSGVNHGFVRDPDGTIAVLDVPGGSAGTAALSLNDAGAIVGYYTDARFVKHGFIREASGRYIRIDAPGAAYGTVIHAINASGAVVGVYADSEGVSHGFIRNPQGHIATVEVLGNAISASGAIAGYTFVPSIDP